MKRRDVWCAAGVVALALGLRLLGIDWGLPAVYEEAYPFKKSWPMWGWGPDAELDLNPYFFNYPSLYFYVQFLGQGVLYVLLRVFGQVDSVLDYRVLYELDKTSFYLMGRTLTVLFACGTVLITFYLGKRLGGLLAGTLAAALMALNPFHIMKSQVIEVDVPLTFFAMLTLYECVRILQVQRKRHTILAGLYAGLATSTKYSGLFLLLPILCAHILALRRREGAAAKSTTPVRRRGERSTAAPRLGLGDYVLPPLWVAGTFAAALFLTSPYILLDSQGFWTGFNYERLHMRMGHFGLDTTPAFVFYMGALPKTLLGWPLALGSLAALVYLLFWRRETWAFVLAVFPVVYVAVISSFSMKADRYILPLVPIAAVCTSVAFVDLVAWLRRSLPRFATVAAAALVVLLGTPAAVTYARGLSRLRPDTRTLARQWLEANVATGAWVVTEAYGPEPLAATDVSNFPLDVRQHILDGLGEMKLYAVIPIPMLQVQPQLVAPFYDLALYDDFADYIVTSSSVGSRYRKDPAQFAPMLAFYDSLAARYDLVHELGPEDGTGPRLRFYKHRGRDAVFARRDSVPSPALQARLPGNLPGVVAPHYKRIAVNLETFGFDAQASSAYRLSARYEVQPAGRQSAYLGAIRCALRAGLQAEVQDLFAEAVRTSSTPEEADAWQKLAAQVDAERGTGAQP